MSGDTRYRHVLWHIEDPTLLQSAPKLELLLDFDPPSRFALPLNCPLSHGIRPSCVLSGAAPASATTGGSRTGIFGGVGGTSLHTDDALVAEWREMGMPSLAPSSA